MDLSGGQVYVSLVNLQKGAKMLSFLEAVLSLADRLVRFCILKPIYGRDYDYAVMKNGTNQAGPVV